MEYSKKINVVANRHETQWGVLLNDGRIISLYDKGNKFYLRWDNPIDLGTMTYEDRPSNEDELTLNKMVDRKMITGEVHCYDTCNYNEEIYPEDLKDEKAIEDKINEIVLFFLDNRFIVSRDAVEHNVHAWLNDFKSGYRDETGNYHLFSPCGCNPLSVRLSTLDKLCEDWQTTYTC